MTSELIAIIGSVCSLLAGSFAFAWKKLIKPAIKFLDDQESVSTEEDETAELISDHVEAKSAEQQCSDQQQVR